MEVENEGQIKTRVLSKLPSLSTTIAPEPEWLEEYFSFWETLFAGGKLLLLVRVTIFHFYGSWGNLENYQPRICSTDHLP